MERFVKMLEKNEKNSDSGQIARSQSRERPTNEVIEIIYSNEETFDGTVIYVTLDVMQSVYSNGYRSKPYLSLKIGRERDGRENVLFLRVNGVNDDNRDDELRWVNAALLSALSSDYKKLMMKRVNEWNKWMDSEKRSRIADHEKFVKEKIASENRDSKVGCGLGRFSKPGKTRRNREKTA